MKKFEGWRTEELQFIASMVAGREMLELEVEQHLYQELLREIRNRRVDSGAVPNETRRDRRGIV